MEERRALISEIASLGNCEYVGIDRTINGLNLVNRKSYYPAILGYTTSLKFIDAIIGNPSIAALIVPEGEYSQIKAILEHNHKQVSYIPSSQPEVLFYSIHNSLWENTAFYTHYESDPLIGQNSKIHPSAVIERGVVIGRNVEIGPNSVVRRGSIIDDNVIIGSCTVIGSEGFQGIKGYNRPIRHVGRTHICHDVYIGDNTTIGNALFEGETTVGAYSKIDNHVHFAHNCVCGENCFITACSLLMGSTVLKDNVWLAPNAVTHNGVVVENNGFVGTMSLAKYDVGEGEVVAGIPARLIRKK